MVGMDQHSRTWTLWRLRSLGTMELLNIPLQAAIWFGFLPLPASRANLTGFVAVSILLVQGAGYWFAKRRQLVSGSPTLPGAVGFGLLRSVNPVLLLAVLGITGYRTVTTPGITSIPGLCFALFAVLEYINYFHVQLMHDTRADWKRLARTGLRRSHLARDLDRSLRRIA